MNTANSPNLESPLAKILSQSALQPMHVLNDAMDMAYDARNLQAFADPQIAPSCVRMIMLQAALVARKSPAEKATRKANLETIRKQEGTYSLMYAQILSLSLQVNLLGEDGISEYLETLGGTSAPIHGPAFLFAFSSHVAHVVHDKFIRARRILSEMYKNRNAAPTESVNLPSLDSLGQLNAEFLLLFLYEERDLILAARYEVPTCWQGWSVLLYQLWIYMRGTVNITNRMTVFLRDLTCRLGLVDSGDYNEENLLILLENSLKDTSGDGHENERNRPMSYDDAQTMTEAFVKRFSGDSPPPMKFSVPLLRWILPGLSEHGRIRHMLLSVMDASLKRVWRAIEGGDGPLVTEQKGLIIEFTQNLFMDVQAFLKDKRVQESQKLALVEILEKHDIIDLAGRVILIFTVGGLTKVSLALSERLVKLLMDRRKCFEQTFAEFGKRHVATQAEFDGWSRVLVHARRMCAQYTRTGTLSSAEEEWWDIGGNLGFTTWGGWAICAWPRCPMPHGPIWYACEGCDISGYCSKECQITHWTVDSPIDNHKAKCEELSKKRLVS